MEKLKEAHDVVYTLGFHKGVMTAGPYAGKSVMDAKPLCKKKLCADGDAFTYQVRRVGAAWNVQRSAAAAWRSSVARGGLRGGT